MGNLARLKEKIYESDNRACFIERERILNRLQNEMQDYDKPDKYAHIFATVLSEVSTPIDDSDYFGGRVVEDLPDEQMQAPNKLLVSMGHMSFDYEKVLNVGLKGILEEVKASARKRGDEKSFWFAKNADIVVTAVHEYSCRYAKVAEEKGMIEMSQALNTVPFEPAYDFYSALQSIWIIHMIASCYVGERDYAFGRFDKYMLPFYEKAIEAGKTQKELCELLAGFFIKTNEICGRTTHNHQSKPILCQASKQYVNIGGESPNAFSNIVLNAAKLVNMAQPQIVVLLKPDADADFTRNTFEALSVLTDKMNIYNYQSIVSTLTEKGIPKEIAKEFTYSACCTFDLNYHSYRSEYFTPAPQIFLKLFHDSEYASIDEMLTRFTDELRSDIQKCVDIKQNGINEERARKVLVDMLAMVKQNIMSSIYSVLELLQ